MRLLTPDGTLYKVVWLQHQDSAPGKLYMGAEIRRTGSHMPWASSVEGCLLALDSGDIEGVSMSIRGIEIHDMNGNGIDAYTEYDVLLQVPTVGRQP